MREKSAGACPQEVRTPPDVHQLLGREKGGGGAAQEGTRQDLPFKEHSEGVFPETRLLLKYLLLEDQPLAVAAVLLQRFADEVQTGCRQRQLRR